MLQIEKIDHIGIRVRERDPSVNFYESLGFATMSEGVFERGQPVIMRHPSGVVINLLGPALKDDGANVLMDGPDKKSGYTHMALRVGSLEEAEAFFDRQGVEITERMSFGDLRAIFVRDPDRNVIEFDEYPGAQPGTRDRAI